MVYKYIFTSDLGCRCSRVLVKQRLLYSRQDEEVNAVVVWFQKRVSTHPFSDWKQSRFCGGLDDSGTGLKSVHVVSRFMCQCLYVFFLLKINIWIIH